MRRITLLVAALIASLVVAAPASAQENGGSACELTGTASFGDTPLTTEGKPFTYSFAGTLQNCQSDIGAPASGTVSAGKTRTIDGKVYQEPVPEGNGSCASSTTTGTSIIDWADGTRTIVQYATDGVTAAVALQGEVVQSVTLTASDGTTTQLETTRFPVGATSLGALVFEADGTQCAGEGVKEAGIHGLTGVGNYS